MPTEFIFSDHDFQGVNRVRNLPVATNPDEPVRKQEFDAGLQGLAFKDNVRVAAPGNVNIAAPGATIDGVALTAGDLIDGAVLLPNQTTTSQNGIYVWNGAAVPMTRHPNADTSQKLENAIVSVDEGTSANVTFRQSSVNFVLGTGAVVFSGGFGVGSAPASTSTAGVAALATQAEVDAGTVNNKIVTPLTLATAANRKLKATAVIGDGTATQFDITHNFGTKNLDVSISRVGSPFDVVRPPYSFPDANTVRINMTPAPGVGAFNVVIQG